MKGLDYSSGRPNPKAVKKAGYGFVCRYLFAPAPGGKGITRAEASTLRTEGLGIVAIYEEYAGRALEGQAAGIIDGKTALAFAHSIDFPDSRPIYFAVDINATAGQQPLIDAYLRGAASVIGAERVGVYGSYYVVERCYADKSAQFFWQTYAWSSGKVSAHTHFLQYSNGQVVGNASVDLNESKQADFGAWEVEVTKPAVVKPAIIPPKPPVVVKPNVAMQWGIDNKIVDTGLDPNAVVTWNSLLWTLYRARGKK